MRNDLQALGSVEMIVFTFPALDFQSSNRVIAGVILIVLGLLVRILEFLYFFPLSKTCISCKFKQILSSFLFAKLMYPVSFTIDHIENNSNRVDRSTFVLSLNSHSTPFGSVSRVTYNCSY